MKKTLECGCSFELDDKGHIILDLNNIPLTCKKTWDLISSGRTKGIFQLESPLGKVWANRLKPENIEHLSALVAILRPGCLKALSGDPPKSMTARYCDRKNRIEKIEYLHSSLDKILGDTYGVLCYQEESMLIAKELAGFSLEQADSLRKAIGHKLPEVMAKVKIEFLEGCKKTGIVDEQKAEEIFGWIQKSSRYAFNKSLTLDTNVELENGKTICIIDVNINDNILTYNNKYTKVINKYNHGKQKVYKITLESGKTIKCTMEHRFLCEDGKILPLSEILLQNKKIMCKK